jgi:hypothetical protein
MLKMLGQAAVWLVVLTASVQAQPPAMTRTFDALTVTVIDAGISSRIGGRIFDLRLQFGTTTQTVRIEDATKVIDDIVSFNSNQKLVVLGSTGSSDIFTVIDVASASVVDYSMCSNLQVSTNARYLAYTRYNAPQSPYLSDVYLVYDVAQSATANRMPGGFRLEGLDVGWTIFPAEARQNRQYVSPETNPDRFHIRQSPLTWISGTRLAFIDYAMEHTNLVLADVADGVDRPRLTIKELDPAAIVDYSKVEPPHSPAGYIRALSISSIPSDTNDLKLRLRMPTGSPVNFTWLDVYITAP